MKILTIETETNNITVHGAVKDAEAVANAERFRNQAGAVAVCARIAWFAANRLRLVLNRPIVVAMD